MRKVQRMKRCTVARTGILIATVAVATMLEQPEVGADEISQILRGYEIISEIFRKKTKLNFFGKDWALVGLGSYLVNSTGCNDCPTHPNYAANHNPYLGQPKQLNTDVYLSGGRIFGPVATPIAVSANIQPDKTTGRPAGPPPAGIFVCLSRGPTPPGDPRDHP